MIMVATNHTQFSRLTGDLLENIRRHRLAMHEESIHNIGVNTCLQQLKSLPPRGN
jgi:hypothetical protein